MTKKVAQVTALVRFLKELDAEALRAACVEIAKTKLAVSDEVLRQVADRAHEIGKASGIGHTGQSGNDDIYQ